jgi:hypothetical protein
MWVLPDQFWLEIGLVALRKGLQLIERDGEYLTEPATARTA